MIRHSQCEKSQVQARYSNNLHTHTYTHLTRQHTSVFLTIYQLWCTYASMLHYVTNKWPLKGLIYKWKMLRASTTVPQISYTSKQIKKLNWVNVDISVESIKEDINYSWFVQLTTYQLCGSTTFSEIFADNIMLRSWPFSSSSVTCKWW